MSGSEGMEGIPGGEGLAEKLARYPGPAYRKAYLAGLLAGGARFLAAGDERGARYCFGKVAEGLNESAPRAEPGEKPLPVTERIRRQWRSERLADAENVLGRHAARLSELERKSYRERLDKLRQSGLAASTAAQSDKADAGILELRRRLYRRVLKSQKISLARQRMPVTLARLALPSSHPVPRPEGPGKVRVDAQWQPVVGPYNDRYNMEDLLGLIADADAAWVQEFLDLYRGLADVQGLVSGIAPPKK
ncbi:MAG TPA: hypothetical protein VJ385_07015 [Fibrobacteria bacterium]|nr:hypothetical protein [Fibrobacteria bacterium]